MEPPGPLLAPLAFVCVSCSANLEKCSKAIASPWSNSAKLTYRACQLTVFQIDNHRVATFAGCCQPFLLRRKGQIDYFQIVALVRADRFSFRHIPENNHSGGVRREQVVVV